MTATFQNSVTRTYKAKLYPTPTQEAALFKLWGAAKLAYNLFLEQRLRAERQGVIHPITVLADRHESRITALEAGEAWADPLPPLPFMPPRGEDGKVRPLAKLTAYDQQKFVKELRPRLGWMHWPSVVFYQQPRDIEQAFKSFYSLIRNSKSGAGNADARPPRYKNRQSGISIGFMNGTGIIVRSVNDVQVTGVGMLKTRLAGTLPDWALIPVLTHQPHGDIRQASYYEITRDAAGTWWLHFIFTGVPVASEPTGRTVGVDLGITHLAAWHDSAGQRGLLANQRGYQAVLSEVQELDRALDRTRRTYFRLNGLEDTPHNRKMHSRKAWSSNRARTLLTRKNRALRHAVRVRQQAIGEATRFLVDHYDVIVIEALNVKGMGEGNLALQIRDAAWGHLHRELERKAAELGRTVIRVNPRNTSRTCPECGHIDADNRKGESFTCLNCAHHDQADLNAARNILALSLRELPAAKKPRQDRTTQ